ncbi:MAG: sulfate reduction electron transfer complex DsrMKJOP subunit DsrO [Thermodesulfobacteriota bacterium]
MDKQRRKFLKIAGASVVAGIGAPAIVKLSASPALASSAGHTAPAAGHAPADAHGGHAEDAPQGVRLGMVIDLRKMNENPELLDGAIAACVAAHNIPEFPAEKIKQEIKWIWKSPFENVFAEHSAYHAASKVTEHPAVALCNHCDDPPCVRACPTQATFKLEKNGVVAMDFHRCIGCRFCMAACPYGARSFNWQDPRPYIKKYNKEFPSRMKGVVEKCNFCGERLALGQEPACVEACKGSGAIVFGDLNDAKSEIRAVLDKEFTIQRKPTLGTKPSVFYIV